MNVVHFKGVGVGIFLRDAAQQGCCARAYMDVFTAIPQKDPDGLAVYWNSIKNMLSMVCTYQTGSLGIAKG